MSEVLLLIAVVAIALYWLNAIRCKDIAVECARRECKRYDVQLLDQTVHQVRMSMSRDAQDRWRLWREYHFEYSTDGVEREKGKVKDIGAKLESEKMAHRSELEREQRHVKQLKTSLEMMEVSHVMR